MRIITSHRGLLQTLSDHADAASVGRTFMTGLPALDALPPGGAFARGAVHEALSDPRHGLPPRSFALLLARSARRPEVAPPKPGLRYAEGPDRPPTRPISDDPDDPDDDAGLVVWSDPRGDLYAPAVAAGGVPLDRLLLLRPPSAREEVWAVAECLRCPAVSAVVAAIPALTRVEARRLQLAAERGGGVGLLLRPFGRSDTYAAATRWLVAPAPGDADVQRWQTQLIHGHGGRVGQSVLLEVTRETNVVRAVEQLADRPAAAFPRRATA